LDLTRNIVYRGFTLNDENILDNIAAGAGSGKGISGCVVDSADFSDVDVIQFIEKRSQRDGMDAGDVYLGSRRIHIAGTLYGLTRGLLYDALATMRSALSPVLAQRESPLDYGYMPLYFSWPTNRQGDYPAGAIPLFVKALPRAFQVMFARDQLGGIDIDALAVPWQATFLCKDPSIFAEDPIDIVMSGSPTAGTTYNRGTYLSPVNGLWSVGAAAGSISATIGDARFTITIPASTGTRLVRFKGEDNLVTIEEDSVEVPRMDLIAFNNATTWPLISPGVSSYSVSWTGVSMNAGSHVWYWERYA
jgi:hypothetical protein